MRLKRTTTPNLFGGYSCFVSLVSLPDASSDMWRPAILENFRNQKKIDKNLCHRKRRGKHDAYTAVSVSSHLAACRHFFPDAAGKCGKLVTRLLWEARQKAQEIGKEHKKVLKRTC